MKFRNIYLGIAFAGVLAGCSEEMDYHEYTTYDADYVFADFNRTAGFVNNIYSYLSYDLMGTNSYASACDEAEMALSYSSVLDFTNGRWSALNPKSQWSLYTGIREANYFLKYGRGLTFSDLKYAKEYTSEMNRYNRYQYEVRLLRAYFYFELVRAYGDVPFTTQVLTEAEANSLSRTPASDVFDFIVSECDAVAPELPVSYSGLEDDAAGSASNPETGRVTRGTALALKARASLYRASKLFNPTEDTSLWKKAAEANLEVIKYCGQNGISLGKYTDIWGTDNYKASEMIFVRRVGDTSEPETVNFPISMENAQAGNCPTQTLVDAYEMKDGSEVDPANPYNGRDPRLGMTIAVNGEKWPNTNSHPLETYYGGRDGQPVPYATPTGYYLKKYLDASTDISASTSSGGKRHSWVVFRLGEFYLNYAEAAFRYFGSADTKDGELTLSAREAVNKVRARADVGMPAFPTGMSTADFWRRYKNERMVELAFEGHRFWDVRRWKEGGFTSIKRMSITKNSDGTFSYTTSVKQLTWDDKMYLYPIPETEMRKNTNLKQNTGW